MTAPKSRTDLLPPDSLLAVGRVLAHGAVKHGERGWERRRIMPEYGAALRHLFSWAAGEPNDPESGESHLAHAAARVLIALSMQLREERP